MCDLSGEDSAKWQESNRLGAALLVPRIRFRARASLISSLLDNACCRLLEEREQQRVTLKLSVHDNGMSIGFQDGSWRFHAGLI